MDDILGEAHEDFRTKAESIFKNIEAAIEEQLHSQAQPSVRSVSFAYAMAVRSRIALRGMTKRG